MNRSILKILSVGAVAFAEKNDAPPELIASFKDLANLDSVKWLAG